jgi:hypothetical protein
MLNLWEEETVERYLKRQDIILSGRVAQQCWLEIPNLYPNMEVDKFVGGDSESSQ